MTHRTRVSIAVLTISALFLGGCGFTEPNARTCFRAEFAARQLKMARKQHEPKAAAACYLDAASLAWQARREGTPKQQAGARTAYNDSSAELTVLLRSAEAGRLWNRTLTLGSGAASRRLGVKTDPGMKPLGANSFTSFIESKKIDEGGCRSRVKQDGVGGALAGIRKPTPIEPFMSSVGFVVPVTATLDFHGRDAALVLHDPAKQPVATVNGTRQPLSADFTAPVAMLPRRNEILDGLMGLVNVEQYLSTTGLYMLEPYDPGKIPVICVHGLVSTPQMWFDVVNEIRADPVLRAKYQFWVFYYPTGNPLVYSAYRFREELDKVQRLHPDLREFVLIGHSMGGLVSRLQATTPGRALWDRAFGAKADSLFARLPADNLVRRTLIFEANPRVKRLIFICTPHRGSHLALSSVGAFAVRLVRLPTRLVTTVTQSLGDALDVLGGKHHLPTSIDSLSPKSSTLLALDKIPVLAPHHSIIGDRGRRDTPKSSDGVVPYWSSHLQSAQSELIVPGPHSSYALPQTIAELKRILHLHLQSRR